MNSVGQGWRSFGERVPKLSVNKEEIHSLDYGKIDEQSKALVSSINYC